MPHWMLKVFGRFVGKRADACIDDPAADLLQTFRSWRNGPTKGLTFDEWLKREGIPNPRRQVGKCCGGGSSDIRNAPR